MSKGNLKGQVTLADGGKTWALCFDFNAICDFEEMTGIDNALEFIERLEKGEAVANARQMRQLFLAALRQNHPEAEPKDAGRLLSLHPDALARAMASASPDAADVAVDGDASGN